MRRFIEQAAHNQDFHDCLHEKFNSRFFDWKITSLFYIAIHCLKALASKKGIDIGDTHLEIEKNVNPDRQNAKMRITKTAWTNYKRLFDYSRTARYEGFSNIDVFEKLMEGDYKECLKHLNDFKKYLGDNGVSYDSGENIETPLTPIPA